MLLVIAVNGQMQQNFILAMQWIMLSNAGQENFDILHSFLLHVVGMLAVCYEYWLTDAILLLLVTLCINT